MKRFARKVLFAFLALVALVAIAVAVPTWSAYIAGLQFSGIGVTFDQVPAQPVEISDIIAGRPAERAGLRKGDEILRVNGEDVSALTVPEVVDRVGGPEGSQVNLVILRASSEVTFSITRERMVRPNPGAAAVGISPLLWAAILLAFGALGTVVTLAVAVFLFSRRAAGPFVSLTALAGFYLAATVMIDPWLAARPDWGWLVVIVVATATVLGMAVLYRFPDGRYVPRATAVGLVLVVGLELARVAAFLTGSGALPDPIRIGELALVASGVLAQVYRYRRVSTPIQRQQTKWFMFGAAVLLGAAGTALLRIVVPEARVAGTRESFAYFLLWYCTWAVAAASASLAIAFGVLKYRLFDIDLIVNRALVYGSATAILAALFAVLSAVSQRAAEVLTGQRNDLVTLALALALALGFAPLRRRIQPAIDRVLPGRGSLTLLFTDIVGSTERIVALGDERWRAVLESYRAAVRQELVRFGGHEVDTAGDGFFATFERPTRAVRCAVALRDALQALDLDSRVGLHVGECELRGERVSGLNVIVAARIMATAKANEIVVSDALRKLLAGEFGFRDRGIESLKGVPGEWRLSMVSEA